MALEINDINLSGTLSATTISATTIVMGSQTLQQIFAPSTPGGYLPISGGTVTGETIFITGLSANTLSGGTILSGSTNLYSIFAPFGTASGVSSVGQGGNITTGGTASNPIINLIASPSVNNITFSGTAIGGAGQFAAVTATSLSAGTLSGGTILSGGTNLYSIFALAGSSGGVNNVNAGSNITTGGTATSPIINLIASPSVNNLTISGLTSSSDGATFSTLSGTNIFSGSVNLQTYFNLDRAQINTKSDLSGATFTGTVNAPSLSATTLSGGTIFSGNTNLQTTFNLFGAVDATKANLSGATFTGTVNAPTLSATTLSAATSVFISGIKFPVSPVSGYILTSDASGNASWAASPTSGSGTTKFDMQSVSNQATTPTATGALVDLSGMTLTTRNLTSSATTYYINFTGDFSNSNNAGSSTFIIVKNGVQISGALTNLSNGGASMASANRTVSIACDVTGITSGDVIKVQMSASTGTVTARNKSLNIIGILNTNLV